MTFKFCFLHFEDSIFYRLLFVQCHWGEMEKNYRGLDRRKILCSVTLLLQMWIVSVSKCVCTCLCLLWLSNQTFLNTLSLVKVENYLEQWDHRKMLLFICKYLVQLVTPKCQKILCFEFGVIILEEWQSRCCHCTSKDCMRDGSPCLPSALPFLYMASLLMCICLYVSLQNLN